MTLYTVPHMALGAELSNDYDERTVLVAIRHCFGAIGVIIVLALGFAYYFVPTPEYPNGQLNGAAYPPFATTLSILMVASILISAFGTRSRIPYMPKAQHNESAVGAKEVISETLQAMKNPSFRWMMFGFILIIVAFGISGATGLYLYTFFWELTQYQILVVFLTLPFGSMVGFLFAKPIYVWLDKRNAMIAGTVCWMLIHAVPVSFYLLGWTPPPGTWAMAAFLSLVTALGGASIALIFVGIGTAMADIADENELDTGRRQEGVFFGASAFANKCSAALGSLLAGWALTWVDWPTADSIRTAADIPQDIVLQMAIITGPITSLLAIPGALCLLGYRLNRAELSQIQSQLVSSATLEQAQPSTQPG